MRVKKWTTTLRVRRYSELRQFDTFEERFDYLSLGGQVGEETFGFERWRNQEFYRSREWKDIRDVVILRDNGCDLGITGYEIFDRVIIHHMNPMTPEDIIHGDADILNPDFLICVSHETHNAIHYGSRQNLRKPLVERRPGDTLLWRPIERNRYADR